MIKEGKSLAGLLNETPLPKSSSWNAGSTFLWLFTIA